MNNYTEAELKVGKINGAKRGTTETNEITGTKNLSLEETIQPIYLETEENESN